MKFSKDKILSGLYKFLIVSIFGGIIAGFVIWYFTKEKTEITFRLEGWITVGSFMQQELPGLSLMLNGESVKNIMKVSWSVSNSGDKGIDRFESGPFIKFPRDLDVVSARISNKSPFLKISENLNIGESLAYVDSLGIFNSGDFFKVDFYLKDIEDQNITNEYFNNWRLNGKSLDLIFRNDIEFDKDIRPSLFWPPPFSFYIVLILMFVPMIIIYFQKKMIIEISKIKMSQTTKDEPIFVVGAEIEHGLYECTNCHSKAYPKKNDLLACSTCGFGTFIKIENK